MEKIRKIGEGEFTLYLYECPKCGRMRDLNRSKAINLGVLAGGGLITSLLFGGPIIGLLAPIGLIKLALAGTITGALAVRAISANYKALAEIGKKKLFQCSNCNCSDLFK